MWPRSMSSGTRSRGCSSAIGGFGVERPGLTVNDRYWELVLTEDG